MLRQLVFCDPQIIIEYLHSWLLDLTQFHCPFSILWPLKSLYIFYLAFCMSTHLLGSLRVFLALEIVVYFLSCYWNSKLEPRTIFVLPICSSVVYFYSS